MLRAHAVGYFYFFSWLAEPVGERPFTAGYDGLLSVSRTLGCWIQDNSKTTESAAGCRQLMHATLLAMVVLPVVLLISGELGAGCWSARKENSNMYDLLVCDDTTAIAPALQQQLHTVVLSSNSLLLFALAGQLLVLLVIPFKWLLMGKVKPSTANPATPKTYGQRFRHHLFQCILEHPAVRSAAFLWTGTALFNEWLRALGAKVGKQAW